MDTSIDLGTKPDMRLSNPSAAPGSGPGWAPAIVVLAMVALLARWLGRKAKLAGRFARTEGTGLRIEQTIPFGPGQLAVVEARGKAILVACTPQGIRHLTDLPETAALPSFLDHLDTASESVAPETDTARRLARLRLS